MDLVVEGDASAFARDLARRLRAVRTDHGRFGTATLILPGGERLDVAGARRETYPRPGALPEVATGASIEEDLARRDLTIHAMALELAPGGGRRVDPHRGAADLARGIVRVLHPRSPVDDPTRAFRAVRYAHRLGFAIAPATRAAIRSAARGGALDTISGDRLRRELERLLTEKDRAGALRGLRALGLDRAIDPVLGRDRGAPARLRRLESLAPRFRDAPGWLCYLLAWMGPASARDARRLADRLALVGRARATMESWAEARRRLPPGLSRRAPSEIARRVRGIPADALAAAAAGLPAADGRAVIRSARAPLELTVRGKDLVAAGIAAGPAIGAALERTRAAREDGRIGPSEERDFAVRTARRLLARRKT